MIQELKLPELGEGIDNVEVTGVLVAPGDTVKQDQPVLEVETEKASLEVPSPFAGTVKEVRVEPGSRISVGATVLTVDTAGEGAPAEAPTAEAPATAPASPAPAEVPTAAPPVPASASAASAAAAPAASAAAATAAPMAEVVEFNRGAQPEAGDPPPAAPSVRRVARELGVDIRRVSGSGPAGRISIEDVKQFVKQQMQRPAPSGGATIMELPDQSRFGPVEREKLSRLRMSAAEKLTATWNAAPHVTQHDRADITDLEAARRAFGKRAEKVGAKLTVTAIALKIAASALKVFPQFNASLDLQNGEVVRKKYVHLGVAVDTDRGLLVPVIRDADQKNAIELAVEVGDLAKRARDRKLTPDEMQGSCFTLSNLGGLGTTYFTPILNFPDVAILGLGRGEVQAVYKDGEFVPRTILPLSLSYDHRWIDGADAARFLRWIAEALENPVLVALEG